MNYFFPLCFLLLVLLVPTSANANFSSSTESHPCMLAEIETIYRIFDLRYVPAEWKKSHLGWDLKLMVADLKDEVTSHAISSQKDFQRLLTKFFRSSRDFHVGILFCSTEYSSLPFRVAFAGKRCFITAINNRADNYETIPVEVGDEIITFDGKPVYAALRAFASEDMFFSEGASENAVAAKFLTARLGAFGHIVPRDSVSIEVLHRGKTETEVYAASWLHHPEKIAHRSITTPSSSKAPLLLGKHPFFLKTMALPFYQGLWSQENRFPELAGRSSPSKNNDLLPSDGFHLFGNTATPLSAAIQADKQSEIITEIDSLYHSAFIYRSPKGRHIGYIRISDYRGEETEAEDFATIIDRFQHNTDALLIDQTNNPGGHLFYMYALASMLTTEPMKTHTHQQALMHVDVDFALTHLALLEQICDNKEDICEKIGSTIQGFHVDSDVIKAFCNHFSFLISEWNQGHWITSPNPLMGIEYIKPHRQAHYSKPIVILVNESSISCGDFMPALLQDNKRALVVGTKTAGAGGHVSSFTSPNRFGIISYSYTASLGLRTDGVTPVENLGVTPDIHCELTPEDYQNNFSSYYSIIDAALEQAISQRTMTEIHAPVGPRIPRAP